MTGRISIFSVLSLLCCACCSGGESSFVLDRVIEVDGRQGVAADSAYYYVSGSTALYKYDKNGTLVLRNESPFDNLLLEANHIGDIDVYNGEIYAGIECFCDGVGTNIQVAVYDAQTLQWKYSIPWKAESGQVEVCGLAVDRAHGRVWMADWVQGHELYCYDLSSHQYIGKVALQPSPALQQGIYCLPDGRMIISCDDGLADDDAPDHLYACDLYPGGRDLLSGRDCSAGAAMTDVRIENIPTAKVSLFRTMNDFLRAGEIEGLCFDFHPVYASAHEGNASAIETASDNTSSATATDGFTNAPATDDGKSAGAPALVVLSNRGSRIILGMVRGFYPGYDREIHEIYVYRQ